MRFFDLIQFDFGLYLRCYQICLHQYRVSSKVLVLYINYYPRMQDVEETSRVCETFKLKKKRISDLLFPLGINYNQKINN